MRVTMRARISGTRNGTPWPGRGESTELPDSEARDLIALGLAEQAETVEAAVPQRDIETATVKTAPRRRKREES